MEARSFPSHPSLEQYKKQAKDLLNACATTDPNAIREWVSQWVKSYADEEAHLQAQFRAVTLTPELRRSAVHAEIVRVEKIIRESKLGKNDPKLADAHFFLALVHGFESWPKFARHAQAFEGRTSPDFRFEAAADAIVSGDMGTLERLLREDPALIAAHSQRTHNSPLLHYVAANGIENFRQKTPKNIVEVARLLLDAGCRCERGSERVWRWRDGPRPGGHQRSSRARRSAGAPHATAPRPWGGDGRTRYRR